VKLSISSVAFQLLEEVKYSDRSEKLSQQRCVFNIMQPCAMSFSCVFQRDELGALVSLEMGKIRTEGVGEVQEFVDIVGRTILSR
jgi:hypothetical protein